MHLFEIGIIHEQNRRKFEFSSYFLARNCNSAVTGSEDHEVSSDHKSMIASQIYFSIYIQNTGDDMLFPSRPVSLYKMGVSFPIHENASRVERRIPLRL